jgi:hypothetical protein
MQARSIILFAYLLVWTAGRACAAPRVGELEVREGKGGVPCFTISEAEERRGGVPDFQSISVADAGAGGKAMWNMAMTAARTFGVSFRMCIPYAGRLTVLPQTPAAPLQPGQPYDVTIEARAPQRGSPRHYHARFCLSAQASGHPRLRVMATGAAPGKARAACPP